MPCAPRVCKMLSFSVMTPYYSEETVYSKSDLEMENEDGISINLQKLYPDQLFKHAFVIDDFHKSPDLFPVKYADPWKRGIVVLLLQDMFEEVTCDMMVNEICSLIKTYALDDFVFPPVVTAQWELGRTGHINTYIKPVQCSMFNLITIYDYLLLTVKESAVGVPTKLRARRRVTFFTNSLFMKITCAPRVRKMLVGFVYWTSAQSLIIKVSGLPTTVKRLSIRRVTLRWKMKMYYSICFDNLTSIMLPFLDEWDNFIERVNCKECELWDTEENIMQLRQWASLRGHTLCRTIRGMMYYRRALKFQAFHDMAKDSGNMNNFLDYFNIWKKEPTRGVQKWIAKHVINMLDPWKRGTVVLLLQDMFEVVTCDMMVNEICELVEFKHSKKDSGRQLFDKTYALDDFVFPPVVTAQWEEQIRRLYLLLTVKESAVDVPINLEARRRVTFFTNSLFMKMPFPGRNHISGNCNVMTPYYSEETVYLKSDLVMENEDKCELWDTEENIMQLRHGASLGGHTLCRTIRCMMYYRRALNFRPSMTWRRRVFSADAILLVSFSDVFDEDSWFLSSNFVLKVTTEDLCGSVLQVYTSSLPNCLKNWVAQKLAKELRVSSFALVSLLKKMAIDHPYHTVFQLLALENGDRIKGVITLLLHMDKKYAVEDLLNELSSYHEAVIR
ncbi:hypothetical protein POM88_049603 [Heracleum sosnowskyi]|uniref:Uncharacterized protein n=1 Tax=Heracleum sosnowskyi TaxID=360622 RepID=A0AAD8GVY3_9APIA|nr:hypothetical protein POM88_049603 [Heracleum sosnowskyi]